MLIVVCFMKRLLARLKTRLLTDIVPEKLTFVRYVVSPDSHYLFFRMPSNDLRPLQGSATACRHNTDKSNYSICRVIVFAKKGLVYTDSRHKHHLFSLWSTRFCKIR